MVTSAQPLRPAVFLDRDGTIIEDVGHLSDPSAVAFLPGAIDALRTLQKSFVLFIVTNQSGVAKGLVTMDQVAAVNAKVVSELERAGIKIERVYVCPHARTDGCECIKPKPHFLQLAAREFGIDLSRSYTIGDHPHDIEFARSVGAAGIYVLTGHGEKHRAELAPSSVVVPSLADAVGVIARQGDA